MAGSAPRRGQPHRGSGPPWGHVGLGRAVIYWRVIYLGGVNPHVPALGSTTRLHLNHRVLMLGVNRHHGVGVTSR